MTQKAILLQVKAQINFLDASIQKLKVHTSLQVDTAAVFQEIDQIDKRLHRLRRLAEAAQ